MQTLFFKTKPAIISTACIVGPKEGQGPLSEHFDKVNTDVEFGADSWEKSESAIVSATMNLAVQKAGLQLDDINFVLAGDLLNQSIGSTFGIRALGRPFLGIFGACSTVGEALALAAVLTDGGYAQYVLGGASSHFCSAEKTFRFPLGLGTQRTPTASWTVTGDGSFVMSASAGGPDVDHYPRVTAATVGKIIDMGIKDTNNMGAAMAPAAADVIINHFQDTGLKPSDYDAIVTGDLGIYGHDLLVQLLLEKGYDISNNSTDCGILIFDSEKQDTHAGGSGCGCAASVFGGYFYKQLKSGIIKRMLLIPTGALMNSITAQQGETIPAIAIAVAIEGAAR